VNAHPTPWAAIRHRIYIAWLNSRRDVRVSSSVYLGRGATIQTDSDGCSFGGRVFIAESVTLSDGVIIAPYGGSIELGANVYIGPYCVLYGHGGLTIGRDTMIGAHTVIIPANHGFARVDIPITAQPLTREGITIGEDVWIGSGCRVLDGVRIGRGAVIGAGSVVTRDIPAYGVAYGVPARPVRNRAAAVTADAPDAAPVDGARPSLRRHSVQSPRQ